MQDFTFKGGQDFLTYGETCAVAEAFGIVPIEEPSEIRRKQIQGIISRCMMHYVPASGESKLLGVYLYKDWEQAEEFQNTYGFALEVTADGCIIGLSESLFDCDIQVHHDLVFLHETAHLSEMNHGDEFQLRYNRLEFDYLYYNHVHMDGGKMPKPDRKGWKM